MKKTIITALVTTAVVSFTMMGTASAGYKDKPSWLPSKPRVIRPVPAAPAKPQPESRDSTYKMLQCTAQGGTPKKTWVQSPWGNDPIITVHCWKMVDGFMRKIW